MKVYFSARLSLKSTSATSVLAGLLAAVILWPSVGTAQQPPPLAEVARKEAERRKTIKTTQKVITTKDLPESAKRPPAAAPPADAGHPAAAPTGNHAPEGQAADAKAAAPAAGAKGDEASWRARITQARESVRRNEAFAEALQSRINALGRDFVNRDNPVQRAKIGEDRQKALEELQKVRTDIEQGKKQIADVEEEARKAGVPPGWLR